MKIQIKIMWKAILATVAITCFIGVGIAIMSSHIILGYISYFIGTISLFYICYAYYAFKQLNNLKQLLKKGLSDMLVSRN